MITIVTDSSVGYSRHETESRGVRIVKLCYFVDGKMTEENLRGENGDFGVVFDKDCKTSQPALGTFSELFASLTEKGGEVLCITLSSGLSGTYSSAAFAAKPLGDRVRVVDSGTTSGGLHLLVDEAVNMVVGGLKLDDIVARLAVIKEKISTMFTVETIEPLQRGGRLSVYKSVNTTLNNRPMLLLSGKITFLAGLRGQKARVDALVRAIPLSARRIFLLKSGDTTDITLLEDAVKKKFPSIKIHIRTIGPVLSVHIGRGAFGVAFLEN